MGDEILDRLILVESELGKAIARADAAEGAGGIEHVVAAYRNIRRSSLAKEPEE